MNHSRFLFCSMLWAGLLAPAAVALPQGTGSQAALVQQSSIIFAGTVSQLGATSFADVPKSAQTIVVRVDFGTSANEVAPSWLTVPANIMLDCCTSAAWFPVPCGNATAAGASMPAHSMLQNKNRESFMGAPSTQWRNTLHGITATLK